MAKKRSASSAPVARAVRSAAHTGPESIDFSDIPESSNEELRQARRVGRPATARAKELIAIRIAPAVLKELRRIALRKGLPYQTYIHQILERAVARAA